MIEKIVEYSVRNPIVVVMLAVGLVAWGIYSTIHTPVDAIPDLSENQVIVFADWPGRSPKEIEDQVTYPLSVNLQGLSGIKAIRATSEFGFSMLNIIFEEHVEFYFARQRILERLSVASTFLPEGVTPYLAPDTTALGQIFWYTVEGEGYDIGRLRAIQDWFVRYQLYSVPGVAEVASVGGFPIEYQIDIDPNKLRSFSVSLGELYSAVERSNSSVGGRVIQKGNSEYLVRSVGWIKSLSDVEKTVIKSVDGTPVYVGDVATVQFGAAQRRNVLEKNGNEAVGGVVLMRFGENPLAVTARIKEKITQLQAGLPSGVRIVPFYDRTGLITRAIDTVKHTLVQESIVASLVILLVMLHLRSALVICLMLPLAVLVSFVLMRVTGISSNIMSLSGIAISIGVLVDAAIVMVDQAAHTLHKEFGRNRVAGDTRELLIPALRVVGRPIFFSLAIMILSFIPVFALRGMEGKMFHPLAYTKTFALVGVSILAITFVPAVIPWMLRGRMRHEEDSWIVRRVIEIYRPVLNFVMDHPWPVAWTVSLIIVLGSIPTGSPIVFFAGFCLALGLAAWAAWNEEVSFRRHWKWVALMWFVAIALPVSVALYQGWVPGWLPDQLIAGRWVMIGVTAIAIAVFSLVVVPALASIRCSANITLLGSLIVIGLFAQKSMTPLGREFMPALDEGSLLDMPVTIPRASVTQVAADLKARDAELRAFPEIEMVVGKTGRAETPTDPAPLDMVETVINLRPREYWPKRELRYDDAREQTRRAIAAAQNAGYLSHSISSDELEQLANNVTMLAIARFDELMRSAVLQEVLLFEQSLAPNLLHEAVGASLALFHQNGSIAEAPSAEIELEIAASLAPSLGQQLVTSPDIATADGIARAVWSELKKRGLAGETADPFLLKVQPWRAIVQRTGEILGLPRSSFGQTLLDQCNRERHNLWMNFVKKLNWQLLDQAVPMYSRIAIDQCRLKSSEKNWWTGNPTDAELLAMQESIQGEFARTVLLWQRSQETLLNELDSVVRMPGWGNIWTQPIINRINMLATGVNTTLGVRVFGNDMNQIAAKCEEIAVVLRRLRGAVDVSADQVVGEGYLQIDIDRERAARYGVSVGDIQDVIETALGGRVITMTVEGRERFPVRIRYARAFREDEEAVKNLLVSDAREMTQSIEMDQAPASAGSSVNEPVQSSPAQIPLSQVADIRIVQGPSMIRSENGLLRSYVRLNVRDRDVIGFVDEARKAVESEVSIPPGMYIEWTGQFEHELRAKKTLTVIVPIVILTIFVLLFVVYHDLGDTILVMCLTVPGAIFGGVLFQYLFGHNFSVAVWVGFIACFGLATENGLVILVYLREAIDRRGGLQNMSLDEVRGAVMEGAVHRVRPKLMTELTTVIGLAPMLWATGTGSEFMQPMAAPILGGILVADEVVDLLLPVMFYRLRRHRWKRLHGTTVNQTSQNEHREGANESVAIS